MTANWIAQLLEWRCPAREEGQDNGKATIATFDGVQHEPLLPHELTSGMI